MACETTAAADTLAPDIQSRIEKHPCYSREAHQYARIHLPVAPACNIQCNYCNRKYDCSNESRPGVVSRLLSPAEAVDRYQKVKQRIPETQVVGIAGPGDPLANPKATLATLRAIKKLEHDLHLCVSTNGLALVDHVDELAELGIDHLTITINCIDAAVGQHIYPWVFFNHRRLRGLEAAQTLIDRQLAGLKAAVAAGMLVKVNTVLIPGVNDHHVEAVAEEVKRLGAFLHNVMPLISDAAHGTYFGVMGQRGPDEAELQKAREAAGMSMRQMSHCQQCRADAVGRLDDDRSCSTELLAPDQHSDEILVAVASKSGLMIDQHFGHAESFDIYKLTSATIDKLEPRTVAQYCVSTDECDDDAAEQRMQGMYNALEGCRYVLCSRIGLHPWQQLEQKNIQPNTEYAMLPIEMALGQLQLELFSTEANTYSSCEQGA